MVRTARGVRQHPAGLLKRCGKAVISSPLASSLGVAAGRDQLKERAQRQKTALQDVISSGYRAAYENSGTKQSTPQKKDDN